MDMVICNILGSPPGGVTQRPWTKIWKCVQCCLHLVIFMIAMFYFKLNEFVTEVCLRLCKLRINQHAADKRPAISLSNHDQVFLSHMASPCCNEVTIKLIIMW